MSGHSRRHEIDKRAENKKLQLAGEDAEKVLVLLTVFSQEYFLQNCRCLQNLCSLQNFVNCANFLKPGWLLLCLNISSTGCVIYIFIYISSPSLYVHALLLSGKRH